MRRISASVAVLILIGTITAPLATVLVAADGVAAAVGAVKAVSATVVSAAVSAPLLHAATATRAASERIAGTAVKRFMQHSPIVGGALAAPGDHSEFLY